MLLSDNPDPDPGLDSRIYLRKEGITIGIRQNMPSKYATTSKVRCDENMHYGVTSAS